MTLPQTTLKSTSVSRLFCIQCKAPLPNAATFCGSCGARVKRRRKQVATKLPEEQDITNRYRITTLIRKQNRISLYFAQDKQLLAETTTNGTTGSISVAPSDNESQYVMPDHSTGKQDMPPRLVVMRDIEFDDLDRDTRKQAVALAQQEYKNLRQWQIPHLLLPQEVRSFQSHLYFISGLDTSTEPDANPHNLHTMQDFLQSGQGLPKDEQALSWILYVGEVVERLHERQIVLGDLDPHTIILDQNCAEASAYLSVFWMPEELAKFYPVTLETAKPQ